MKKKKKGFTLVELLVVIAILAILAAVSVVGYLSFTNKAKQSADEQAVTQMNIALEAQEAIDAPDNVEEAKDVLEEAGFNVSDYVPLNKDNIFYYDQSEIRVLIYDQSAQKVTFPENLVNKYSNVTEKLGNWYLLNDKSYIWNSLDGLTGNISDDSKTFKDALQNAESYNTIRLESDITINNLFYEEGYDSEHLTKINYYFPVNNDGIANIDLNGHTLTLQQSAYVGGCTGTFIIHEPTTANVTISNGTIVGSTINSSFIVEANSSLTLENVDFTIQNETNDKNILSVGDYANLTVSNSTINAGVGDTCSVFLGGNQSETNIFNSTLISNSYGITSNASGDESWNIKAKVDSSYIITKNGSAVLLNVPGKYTFTKSTIEGNGIGVAIRGGEASFENCTITESGDNTWMNTEYGVPNEVSLDTTDNYKNGNWANGDMIQYGGLIVGDWASSYNYDASCKLINTSIHMNDTWTELPIVYLSQDNGNTTTFTYDDSCKFYKGEENFTGKDAIKLNSAKATYAGLKQGKVILNGDSYTIG